MDPRLAGLVTVAAIAGAATILTQAERIAKLQAELRKEKIAADTWKKQFQTAVGKLKADDLIDLLSKTDEDIKFAKIVIENF